MGGAINASLALLQDPVVRFHRFRYHIARGFIDPFDRVLDLGCGTGYGSEMLSEVTLDVDAYDKDPANIDWAKKYYRGCGINYHLVDLEKIEIPEAEVAVSFEVIEHLYHPKEFIEKLKKAISRLIIVSVPLAQQLVWVEEAKEFQEINDSTHHSAFANQDVFKELFVNDDWVEYYSLREGVTYICIFYNNKYKYDS